MEVWLTDPQIWVSLVTLTVMEIVLGIDNVVFISVVVARLPKATAVRARQIGLSLALVFRIILLVGIVWIIGLTAPLFSVFGHVVSWRDLILIAGGLFLLAKSTHEIHQSIEEEEHLDGQAVEVSFFKVIIQIVIIDIIFSVDSIVTAIGIAEHVEVMIAAVIIAMFVMYVASGPVSDFIDEHPTTKMLALSFLILIGAALVADGLGFHIPRGYIYFSMAFATAVEVFNVMAGRRRRQKKRTE